MVKFQCFVNMVLIFYSCLLTMPWSLMPVLSEKTNNDVEDNNSKLRLVSMVFRHGDRTTESVNQESYPTDPYKGRDFYPDGEGQLTNMGKKRSYKLGLVMRDKYNDFLGDVYYPPHVYARSSYYPRSKMTLQLVLAALYPPSDLQRWNSQLSWQPIDMIYSLPLDDALLVPVSCSKFFDIYNDLVKSDKIKHEIKKFDNLKETISKYTEQDMSDFLDLFRLYGTLYIESHLGFDLPEWTQEIFPDGELLDAALFFLKLLSYGQLNNLNGGVLLNKITDVMNEVINGNLQDRKINLFSGHDLNVAALLYALNISDIYDHRYPEFTSTVIIELHEKDEMYFVKVLYYSGIPSEILEVSIPGCEELCPYDKFIKLTESSRSVELPCQLDKNNSRQMFNHTVRN